MSFWKAQRLPVDAGRVRHFITAILVAGVFVAGFALGNLRGIGSAQGAFSQPSEADDAFSAFWQAYQLIRADYIDPVTVDALADGALRGLLDALDDEYSGYMDPDTFDMMNADLQGEIEGIGVVIRTDEDSNTISVVSLLEGSPAQAAGILPGDIFAAVNGEQADNWSQLDVASRVRGPAGTDVTITMLRGEDLIDFTITRQRIVIPNIVTDILENDIAYIQLNSFTPEARTELDQALAEVDVNNRTGLIFDLRHNPGGLLSSAVEVSSAFVREGTIVTEWFGDDEEDIILGANGTYADIQVPIVLLVNEASASASEIVAGAMQDYGIATLIGAPTFGKGTVQTWHPLVNGGGARITIARWLRPNGDWIEDAGVTPDILVEWLPTSEDEDDLQLNAAIEYLLSGEVVINQSPASADARE